MHAITFVQLAGARFRAEVLDNLHRRFGPMLNLGRLHVLEAIAAIAQLATELEKTELVFSLG